MPPTLEVIDRDPITLESAVEEECNVINWASYKAETDRLYDDLWVQRHSIEALIKHHLALGRHEACHVLPPDHWIRGSFNICVLAEISSGISLRKVVFRCPLPHKLAESRYPGSIDEKLGCEVGAYVWVEECCPEIRSPYLFGFGFLDGRHFTHSYQLGFFRRFTLLCRRAIHRLFRLPLLSHYVRNPPKHRLSCAYMVLEYLGPDTGRMLSDTFEKHRESEAHTERLFRGLSRIMLSLARIPQAQIGSLAFNNTGTVTLTNRPLTSSMMISENDGAARTVRKDDTFSCTDAFVSDMLAFHDHRFLKQPNAVYDESDCRGQMAVKTLLRVVSSEHIKREYRSGLFPLQLTDLHASNIFVDEQWNVTGLIDLEWMCALPVEMFAVPYWLTGCAVDEIKDEKLAVFDRVRRAFIKVFEQEEQAMKVKSYQSITLSQVMQDMWDSKSVWFWYCLSSVNAMYFLLETHLLPPRSLSTEAERIVSRFWSRNSEDVVLEKLADREAYLADLRKLFGEQ